MNELRQSYLNELKYAAKRRQIPFALSLKDAKDVFDKQQGKCYFTGVWLVHKRRKGDVRTGNASIDRIDTNKGYSKDNIRWVDKDINELRSDFEDSKFLNLCRRVIAYRG